MSILNDCCGNRCSMYEDQKSIAECINNMPDDWNQRCAYQNGVTLYSETPSDRIFEAIEARDEDEWWAEEDERARQHYAEVMADSKPFCVEGAH